MRVVHLKVCKNNDWKYLIVLREDDLQSPPQLCGCFAACTSKSQTDLSGPTWPKSFKTIIGRNLAYSDIEAHPFLNLIELSEKHRNARPDHSLALQMDHQFQPDFLQR